MVIAPVRRTTSLSELSMDELKNKINENHRRIEDRFRKAVIDARKAGEFLIEAKSRVDAEGTMTWKDWLAINFEGSERTDRSRSTSGGKLENA